MLHSTDRPPIAWLNQEEAPSDVRNNVSEISVRFVEDDRPFISVLEVVVPGKWDVIADVYRTLYNLRTQVIHSVIRYMDEGTWLRYRLYVVEFDGAMLDQRRHSELIETVDTRLRALAPEYAHARRPVRPEPIAQSGVRRTPLARTSPVGIESARQVAQGR